MSLVLVSASRAKKDSCLINGCVLSFNVLHNSKGMIRDLTWKGWNNWIEGVIKYLWIYLCNKIPTNRMYTSSNKNKNNIKTTHSLCWYKKKIFIVKNTVRVVSDDKVIIIKNLNANKIE